MVYYLFILIIVSAGQLLVVYTDDDSESKNKNPVCTSNDNCIHIGHLIYRATTHDCCKRCEVTHGCIGYVTRPSSTFKGLIHVCYMYDVIHDTNTTSKDDGMTCGQLSDGQKHGHRNLYRKFNIPPPPYLEERLQITIEVMLNKITHIDVMTGIIELSSYIYLKWRDVGQQWDPKEIGVDTIQVPIRRLWLPDLAIFEPLGNTFSIFQEHTYSMHARVQSTGDIMMLVPFQLKAALKGDADSNSFKVHINIGGWSHHQRHYNLSANTDNLEGMYWYIKNPCWSIGGVAAQIFDYAYYTDTYQTLAVDFTVARTGATGCSETSPLILLKIQAALSFLAVIAFFYCLSKCTRFGALMYHYYDQSNLRPTVNMRNIASILYSAMTDRNVMLNALHRMGTSNDTFSECNTTIKNNNS